GRAAASWGGRFEWQWVVAGWAPVECGSVVVVRADERRMWREPRRALPEVLEPRAECASNIAPINQAETSGRAQHGPPIHVWCGCQRPSAEPVIKARGTTPLGGTRRDRGARGWY